MIGAGGGPGGPRMVQMTPEQFSAQQAQLKAMCKKQRYLMLYPAYLESSYTVAQGRRVSKSACAGCTDVNVLDVMDGAVACGFSPVPPAPHTLPAVLLEQMPRLPCTDPMLNHPYDKGGRVRIRLRADDGTPLVAGIESKEALLLAIARVIPSLDSRRMRNAQKAADREAHMRRIEEERARQARALPAPQLKEAAAAGGGASKVKSSAKR